MKRKVDKKISRMNRNKEREKWTDKLKTLKQIKTIVMIDRQMDRKDAKIHSEGIEK